MESIALRNIGELLDGERRSLETLLKHPLRDGQRVFIMAFDPGVIPDDARRAAAHRDVLAILDTAQARAEAAGVTAEEADAAVEEAMRDVRSRPS